MILSSPKTNVKKLALSSILAALGTATITIGSFFEILDLTLAVVASFFALFAYLEIGRRYSLMIYLATSLLSFIIAPSKFCASAYLFFFGFYPLIKPLCERLPKIPSYVLKLLIFNSLLSLLIAVSIYVLGLPPAEFGFSLIVYVLGNAAFILYDEALTRLVYLYELKLRKRLIKSDFFKY